MYYPVPYQYHDLIVDRRGGRPDHLRRDDSVPCRIARRRWRGK